MAKIINAGS